MSDGAKAILVIIGIFVFISMLSPVCSRSPDVNEELARTARIATESAQQANQDAAAFRNAVDRWYFVGMALAAGVPLVLAVILFVYATKTPAEPTEVFRELDQIRAAEHRKPAIGDRAGELTAETSEKDDSATREDDGFERKTIDS